MSLASARLYLVAPTQLEAGALADLVPELAEAGVDLIQLREKDMEAGDLLRAGEPVAGACRAAGLPFIVNDRPDVALALGADGVHLGQNDLPPEVARLIIGTAIVGLSTHTNREVNAVAGSRRPDSGGPQDSAGPGSGEPQDSTDSNVDYIAVGPVHTTPTKPGRPAVGVRLLRHAADRVELPWFAIGGIEAGNVEEVLAAGARRIVVVRAITKAADPPGAAAALRAVLNAAQP